MLSHFSHSSFNYFSSRACVTSTLEGKGVTRSECPACHMPAWKKDLRKNCTYEKIAEALQVACRVLEANNNESKFSQHYIISSMPLCAFDIDDIVNQAHD
jgi:hypothetical protein